MIISNTSTLILLAKVNALSLLLNEIKRMMIPEIVYEEFIVKKDALEVLLIKKEVKKERIIVENIDKKFYSNVIKEFKLDEGEAAAYALFKTKKGKLMLTDDKELMKLCKIENIPFVCAFAVIVKLFKKKILTREEALEKLENLYGYGRYSSEIYKFFKEEVK